MPDEPLDELREEIRVLRQQNDALRARVDAIDGASLAGSPAAEKISRPQSRRALLRRAGIAMAGGIGAVAVGGLSAPRPADAGGGALGLGQTNISNAATAIVSQETYSFGVYSFGVTDHGLNQFPDSAAIAGHAKNTFKRALLGYHEAGGTGVMGWADGQDAVGVWGTARGGSETSSTQVGVYGYCDTAGTGVYGRSSIGRGGVFSGLKAPLRLMPNSRSTHPAQGLRGDLFVDSGGRLWYCRQGGASSVWKQLA
jgi:hypothetical protein